MMPRAPESPTRPQKLVRPRSIGTQLANGTLVAFLLLSMIPGLMLIGLIVVGRAEEIRWFHLPALLWLLAVIGLIGWGIRPGMRQAEQDDRKRRGQCLACGYDLRQTPDRCPECGATTHIA